MKRNWLMRIGAAALVVGVMSMSMIGGTLAKYTTTVSGTGTATVAKWSFKAAKSGDEAGASIAKINLNDAGNIMPGSNGSFAIVVDPTGTETDLGVEIKLDTFTNLPQNLILRKESKTGDLLTGDIKDGFTLTDTITDDNKVSKTYTIYWEWPYESSGDIATADAVDVTLAQSQDARSFNITVTGTQIEPTTTPAS